MPDSAEFKWFVPSRHGDQDPDALLTNRTMNRIDIVLLAVVALCTIWNVLGVREVKPGSEGIPTLAGADDFFLRPSTIVLWSVVALAILWLVMRMVITRETRFVLVWEGAILALAALMPLLSMEMAGLSVMNPAGELRLTAYECPGAAPAVGAPPALGDCGGLPIESRVFRLVGKHPDVAGDAEGRTPDAISGNTATWKSLPSGTYTMYLLVDIPGLDCTINRPGVIAIDADLEIDCLDSGASVVRLTHPGDSRNLRLSLYPHGSD